MTYSPAMRYRFSEINALDALTVDAMCSLYTLELGGQDYYEAIGAAIDDPAAKALLARNGREEAGHARRLGRAIALKLGQPFEPTAEMTTRRPVELGGPADESFLRALLEGERSGDVGYQKWADNEADPAVERLLRLNGREESLHAERLEQVLALLHG